MRADRFDIIDCRTKRECEGLRAMSADDIIPLVKQKIPCSFANHQVMTIRCSSGANIVYKYNLLEGVIGDTYVQSYRDGLLASRPY